MRVLNKIVMWSNARVGQIEISQYLTVSFHLKLEVRPVINIIFKLIP